MKNLSFRTARIKAVQYIFQLHYRNKPQFLEEDCIDDIEMISEEKTQNVVKKQSQSDESIRNMKSRERECEYEQFNEGLVIEEEEEEDVEVNSNILRLKKDFNHIKEISTNQSEDIAAQDERKKISECLFDKDLFNKIIDGSVDELSNYDIILKQYIKHIDNVSLLLKAILKTAICEKLKNKLHNNIIINEYVEITKMFFGPHSEVKLANGVLHAIFSSKEFQ